MVHAQTSYFPNMIMDISISISPVPFIHRQVVQIHNVESYHDIRQITSNTPIKEKKDFHLILIGKSTGLIRIN